MKECRSSFLTDDARYSTQGVTDADLREINRYSLKPLEKKDVSVITMDLVNDKVDRHFSRFPHKEIRQIARLVKGKPLMVNHDMPGGMNRGSLPRGVFFRSAAVKDEAGSMRAQGEAFVLKTSRNAEFIKQIEGGVYRGTSVGFAFETPECSVCGDDMHDCPHWPGLKYDGEVCHYIMHGVTDVREQSIVPLGSQGTEVTGIRGTTTQDALIERFVGAGKPGDHHAWKQTDGGVYRLVLDDAEAGKNDMLQLEGQDSEDESAARSADEIAAELDRLIADTAWPE